MRRSRTSWLSLACLVLGLALVLIAISKTAATRSDRYWPLLVIGFLIGCASAPFYYYYKAKDKTAEPYEDVQIQTLNQLAKEQKSKEDSDDPARVDKLG